MLLEKGVTINSTDDLKRAYPDRFQGIGNFEGHFHITTDPDVTPVVHAPRRCPIALKDEIKRELDTMEDMGVMSRVSQPTEWVSSMVYNRKSSGRLRICLDPKDLNRAIKRPYYHTRTLEEITHKLAGATVFSKLDAHHGYWYVKFEDHLQQPFRSVPIPETTIRLELEPGRVPAKDGPDPRAVHRHHQHRR